MRAIALLAALFASLACQDPDPHPPVVSSCAAGQYCPQTGLGQVRGPSGTAGANGAGGSGVGGGGGQLRGTVVDLIDDTFTSAIAFGEPATVEAQSTTGSVISAAWNGIDPFSLSGVEASALTWISVRPNAGIANLRTLHPISTNVSRTLELGLARAESIDIMYALLEIPTQRAAGTGQIVLSFTIPSGASVTGAKGVSVVLPEAGVVAYESSGVWSSDAKQTSTSGYAVLGNVPASVFPGVTKRVALGGLSSGFIDVRVAADAVSVVSVALSP